MRKSLMAMAFVSMPLAGFAQERAGHLEFRDRPGGVMPTLPVRAAAIPAVASRVRDYRIDPAFRIDRSAHARALDEMNAINLRRPSAFRFRPVMALTLDAADLDAPPRVAGIAPTLMGMKAAR